RVQAQIPGDTAEKLVAVEAGTMVSVGEFDLQFDLPAPLASIRSAHEQQQKQASAHSKNVHATIGTATTSRIILFARTRGESRSDLPRFVLRSQSERISFPSAGAYNLNEGWMALTVALPAGTYVLEQDVPKLGKRAQVLFAEENWETQVFAPWDSFPDFARASIYIRPLESGFDPQQYWEYERTEAALDGLARGHLVMNASDRDQFLNAKFSNPMLGIIGAYALLNEPDIDYGGLRHIADNLLQLLPHSPDAKLISLLANAGRGFPITLDHAGPTVTFEEPPLLTAGTERVLGLAVDLPELLPVDSWFARISLRLTSGSAWTRWDPSISGARAFGQLKYRLRTLQDEALSLNRQLSAVEAARALRLPQSLCAKALAELRPNVSVEAIQRDTESTTMALQATTQVGAAVHASGMLRLPAPYASTVDIRFAPLTARDHFNPTDWRREDLRRSPARDNYWEINLDALDLKDGDYEYEFILDGQQNAPIADPYAEEIVRFGGYRGLFRIRDGQRWRWPFSWDDELPANVQLPNNNQIVIYEMPLRWMSSPLEEIRQVSLGTFERVVFERLDQLMALGINAIELLPVQDSPDTLNWGYGSRFFFAPDFDMGTPIDLKFFVKFCHQRGIRVLLDVVMNHAKECPLEQLAGDWFFLRDSSEEPGRGENWGGRWFRYRQPAADGHYPAREFHYQMAEFWVREYHIDGFRIDEF
ncbi:MAG: hypothetical protein CYG59_17725, partial [Chloroflexi bacterium]